MRGGIGDILAQIFPSDYCRQEISNIIINIVSKMKKLQNELISRKKSDAENLRTRIPPNSDRFNKLILKENKLLRKKMRLVLPSEVMNKQACNYCTSYQDLSRTIKVHI